MIPTYEEKPMNSTTRTCYGIAPFGLLLAALSSFLTSDELAKSARNVKQIIAHRGASSERPECTLAAIRRAIEVGATAVEMDVRTSKDGVLFLLHDTTLERTTDGKGNDAAMTIDELKQLDAGSWFDPDYENERIPTLREALTACRRKIAPVLDLKEQGKAYAKQVAAEVREFGEPARTIVGVRSVAQARQIRELLPEARQLGLIPNPDSIEPFADAGVETIRLWPRWLKDQDDLVHRVRKTKSRLHLNGRLGTLEEITPLLTHGPDSLSSDDPVRLLQTLNDLAGQPARLCFVIEDADL